jgi:hypothetical protein
LNRDPLPYVAKSPYYTGSLGGALAEGDLDVQCCIVPVRDLYSAAESRRHVSRQAEAAGLDPRKHRGGLAFKAQRNPARQEERLAVQFYKLVQTLVAHDITIHFLSFPNFVTGSPGIYDELEPLLSAHGVSPAESAAAMATVADPAAIHRFQSD